MAAGEAIAYLADIFQHQSAEDLYQHALECGVSKDDLPQGDPPPLGFAGFSLQQVLERGTPLGASGGQVRPAASQGLQVVVAGEVQHRLLDFEATTVGRWLVRA